jgi:uncharacterized membrane protein
MNRLKRYFAAGILVGLPVFITLYLLFIIFKFLDNLFGVMVNKYLREIVGFSIPGVGIILGILLILILGFIVSHLLSKRVLPVLEGWFLKLPGIRQLYPPIKEIVGFIFTKEKPAFKKVVLVEYPSEEIWSVGFMTNDGFREAQKKLCQ